MDIFKLESIKAGLTARLIDAENKNNKEMIYFFKEDLVLINYEIEQALF